MEVYLSRKDNMTRDEYYKVVNQTVKDICIIMDRLKFLPDLKPGQFENSNKENNLFNTHVERCYSKLYDCLFEIEEAREAL